MGGCAHSVSRRWSEARLWLVSAGIGRTGVRPMSLPRVIRQNRLVPGEGLARPGLEAHDGRVAEDGGGAIQMGEGVFRAAGALGGVGGLEARAFKDLPVFGGEVVDQNAPA